jgi:hypothetical protein
MIHHPWSAITSTPYGGIVDVPTVLGEARAEAAALVETLARDLRGLFDASRSSQS